MLKVVRDPDRRLRAMSILLALLTAVAVGFALFAITRSNQIAIDTASANSANSAPTLAEPPPVVAIVGDEFAADAPSVPSGTAWSQRLMVTVPARVSVLAATNSAYVPSGRNAGPSFSTLAKRIPTDAKVVIFFGGSHDRSSELSGLSSSAAGALAVARNRAPHAKILVVGPVATAARSSTALQPIRTALGRAAGSASAVWLDPISMSWFSGSDVAVLGDGVTLSGLGERVLRDRFTALIKAHI